MPVSPQISGIVPESLPPTEMFTPQVSQDPAVPLTSGGTGGESSAIDLEAPEAESDEALCSSCQPILHCEDILSTSEDLLSWDTLSANQQTSDILLAHDELVFHAEPPHLL